MKAKHLEINLLRTNIQSLQDLCKITTNDMFVSLMTLKCKRLRFVTDKRDFAYGFHSRPVNLQKVSFWRAKGNLSECERPCIACQKTTF